MTGTRENNEPDDIYKNLYKDATFLREKKEDMIEQHKKKVIADEAKESTFRPNISPIKTVDIYNQDTRWIDQQKKRIGKMLDIKSF